MEPKFEKLVDVVALMLQRQIYTLITYVQVCLVWLVKVAGAYGKGNQCECGICSNVGYIHTRTRTHTHVTLSEHTMNSK